MSTTSASEQGTERLEDKGKGHILLCIISNNETKWLLCHEPSLTAKNNTKLKNYKEY